MDNALVPTLDTAALVSLAQGGDELHRELARRLLRADADLQAREEEDAEREITVHEEIVERLASAAEAIETLVGARIPAAAILRVVHRICALGLEGAFARLGSIVALPIRDVGACAELGGCLEALGELEGMEPLLCATHCVVFDGGGASSGLGPALSGWAAAVDVVVFFPDGAVAHAWRDPVAGTKAGARRRSEPGPWHAARITPGGAPAVALLALQD